MNDLYGSFLGNPFEDDKSISKEEKLKNKSTRTLHKGIECVHCEHIFDCAGHLGDLCVNFKDRK